MKEKLLDLVDQITNDDELSKMTVSLTINYEKVISDYKREKISKETIKKKINEFDKVKGFNLTLYDYFPEEHMKERDYNKFWYNLQYIFYGDKRININFNFLSNQVHKETLRTDIQFNGKFDRIKKIGKVYRDSAKLIYKTIKS